MAPARRVISVAAAAMIISGCGSSDDVGTIATTAPVVAAVDFCAAGETLSQTLSVFVESVDNEQDADIADAQLVVIGPRLRSAAEAWAAAAPSDLRDTAATVSGGVLDVLDVAEDGELHTPAGQARIEAAIERVESIGEDGYASANTILELECGTTLEVLLEAM